MIKVSGLSGTRSAGAVKKSGAAGKSFAPASTTEANASSAPSAAAPAAMMSALIALQSKGDGGRKTFAAAQQTLDALEQLQMRVLDGQASEKDLEALSHAANVRAHAGADPQLQQIYDQISLRARVELAKLGR